MRAIVLIAVLASACSKSRQEPAPAPTAASPTTPSTTQTAPTYSEWYRAVVAEKQGTPIPFFVQIPATGDDAFIATGPDRIRAKLASREPELVLEFDVLRTRIAAKRTPDGGLAGAFESSSGSWGAATLSFTATAVDKPDPALRFERAAAGPDPVGVWKIALPDQHGKLTVQRGDGVELLATFAFQTGNLAFLAGVQDGRTIRLSAFDGSSPYLLVGELDEAGKALTGTWTAGQALAWKESFEGKRSEDFALELQTKLVSKRPKLKAPQIAKYAGKPLIVELGGTWCPACGHAADKLKELRTKHAADGLEIVMLAYEFTDDSEYNRAQAESFKAEYDIPWEVIPVDGGLDKYLEILPSELEDIDASGFPITLFVARDGGIEGFHSGFPPTTWGDVHHKASREYDRLTAAILKK